MPEQVPLFKTELDQLPTTRETVEQRRLWLRQRLLAHDMHRPLKVLIASNSIGCGGEEHQVMRLIPELRALGVDVEHFYYCAPHTLQPKYKANGIDSVFIDKNGLGQVRFWKEAVRFFKKQRFDLVHAFGGTANIYVKGAALLAGSNTILSGSRNRYLGGGGFLQSLHVAFKCLLECMGNECFD